MMMRVLGLLLVVIGCSGAWAAQPPEAVDPPRSNAERERESLARIVSELEIIEVMARDTQPLAGGSRRRVRFRYEGFIQDLERMKHGIREYLAAPDTTPRQVEPVRGDYRY